MHRTLGAVVLIGPAAMGLGQEAKPAAVDRADPKAVATAYLDFVEAGNAEAAMALLGGDAELREGMKAIAGVLLEEGRNPDMSHRTMLTEIGLLPVGHLENDKTLEGGVEGNEATFSVTQRLQGQMKLVLSRNAQGQWCVDIERSVKATTGLDRSSLVEKARQMHRHRRGGEGTATVEGDREGEWAIRVAAALVLHWAEGHDWVLPPAETWLDDVETYRLDGLVVRRPGAREGECGYALNMALAGRPLPREPEEREKLVLLFECADYGRNIVGDPEQELLPAAGPGRVSWVAMADGFPLLVAAEQTLTECLQIAEVGWQCRSNVRALIQAVRSYARDNEGRLPLADTWCDDIQPYLDKAGAGADVLRCPGAPNLEYGYAINEAVAGMDARSLRDHDHCVVILPAVRGQRNESRALPDVVQNGRHPEHFWRRIEPSVVVGMLNGDVQVLSDGLPYPRGGM